eukprot:2999225-Rhodomonas_salina.3
MLESGEVLAESRIPCAGALSTAGSCWLAEPSSLQCCLGKTPASTRIAQQADRGSRRTAGRRRTAGDK